MKIGYKELEVRKVEFGKLINKKGINSNVNAEGETTALKPGKRHY